MNSINKISFSIAFLLILMGSISVFVNQTTESSLTVQELGETYYVGNYQVQIKLNPDKPKIGNNHLMFSIRDESNNALNNVTITAYAEMPAMGSMQAMREPISIENSDNGLYQGEYSLPMNGSWPLFISLQSTEHGLAKAVFDMNTSRSGLKLEQATLSKLGTQENTVSTSGAEMKSFKLDNYRRQLIGVTTTEVICQHIIKTIPAAAKVSYNQAKITDISLKYDTWIGELNADYVGKKINKGDTLFTVYSPELIAAQDEYLESLKQKHSYGLRKASRKRLTRWDIQPAQIKAIQQRGRSFDYLPITSTVTGTVIEKNIVAGSASKLGSQLLRIADLSSVWLEAEVYEADLPWLSVGMEATITFPDLPEQTYTAEVSYIAPELNPLSRSALIRVQLNNEQELLKPNQFATMNLQADLGRRKVIPEQAVIYSGKQRVVFIDLGNGRLLPRKIKTGVRNEGLIEVLDGLDYGDIVVTSGNFLIAAESKLKSGLAQW